MRPNDADRMANIITVIELAAIKMIKSTGNLLFKTELSHPYMVIYNYALSRENLSSGFANRLDSYQPAQLQRQARVLNFWV